MNVYIVVGWGAVQGAFATARKAQDHISQLDDSINGDFKVQKWPVES